MNKDNKKVKGIIYQLRIYARGNIIFFIGFLIPVLIFEPDQVMYYTMLILIISATLSLILIIKWNKIKNDHTKIKNEKKLDEL